MAATNEMVGIACSIKPEMAMLVPEGRHEITTEGGLDILAQEASLKDAVARIAGDGDRMPGERRVDPRADRLGERFLRGPALGEVAGACPGVGALEARALGGREHAVHEALAVALEHARDPFDGTNVGPDAHDHLASRIRFFISRTASRMPT